MVRGSEGAFEKVEAFAPPNQLRRPGLQHRGSLRSARLSPASQDLFGGMKRSAPNRFFFAILAFLRNHGTTPVL